MTKFQDIWGRLIQCCVKWTPWDAMVDFKAREWPVANARRKPDQLGMRDYTELSGEVYTSMQVILRQRKIELVWFPSSDLWHARGYVTQNLDWVESVSWSPTGGKTLRGHEQLERIAEVAMDWLTQGKGADYGKGTNRTDDRIPLCGSVASIDGQGSGGGVSVGEPSHAQGNV